MRRPDVIFALSVLLVCAGPAVVFGAAPPGTRSRPAAAALLHGDAARIIDLASAAPLARYIIGLRLARENAEVRFDEGRRRWIVVLRRTGRPVLRVVIDAESRDLIAQAVLRRDGTPAPSVGEAERLLRASDDIGPWLTRYPHAWVCPEYDLGRDGWVLRIYLDNHRVGNALIVDGAVRGEGPWHPPPGVWGPIQTVWLGVRPPALTFRFIDVVFPAVVIFLLLLIDVGRLRAMRTLDVLVLAAFVVAKFVFPLDRPARLVILMAGTVYLTCRLARRGLRPKPAIPASPSRVAGAIAVILLALAWQTQNVHQTDFESAEQAGLLRGARLIETGTIGYGEGKIGYDTYGPFHYVAYGLIEQAFPAGMRWDAPEIEQQERPVNPQGGVVLALGFHGLVIAALIGLAQRLGGDWRRGVVLSAAYLVLSVAMGRFWSGSYVPPPALVMVGLLSWPNPYAAGACLGLATADMWFPVVLFPLWLGSFRRGSRARFALVYAAVGLLFLWVALLGPGSPWERLQDLYRAVVVEQATQSGTGFWAMFAAGPARSIMRGCLVAVYLALCVAAFRWPRRIPSGARETGPERAQRPVTVSGPHEGAGTGEAEAIHFTLVALTGALVAATQVWKHPHGPEYVAWYLPMALVALFTARKMVSDTQTERCLTPFSAHTHSDLD